MGEDKSKSDKTTNDDNDMSIYRLSPILCDKLSDDMSLESLSDKTTNDDNGVLINGLSAILCDILPDDMSSESLNLSDCSMEPHFPSMCSSASIGELPIWLDDLWAGAEDPNDGCYTPTITEITDILDGTVLSA
jgi:hypothetical protein